MQLELNDKECRVLQDLPAIRIDGPSLEIHRSENHDYRRGLEEMQQCLQAIYDRLTKKG